ncbi:DUF1329 domain-containing protein [Pseudomonas alkylphenolica]|uniref:DUF1329 domain-containing protein n=1 Tax=Pseudomonas alkylphenolica TaxID=237609 RepID=A0A443ZK26_9PSED|nr:DUF1329 domain-containing protein [Pseudomonas alkylphenolica]MBH3426426.1 DUF1329 domain-containing protein [Pseudomonas alkylphenolica]RWU19304.1 DUF1329 domain-containing protein [Pseudomonas alkylphenolica]
MIRFRPALRSPLLAGLIAASAMAVVNAAEVPPGTVISASNIDQLKTQTFEGHTIASLLTEKLEWRIRNSGMQMPLAASKAVPLDPRWVKASAANAGKTSINKAECRVDGWGAGEPFPQIDEKDPQAAEKIMWNWHLGQLVGDISQVPGYTQLLVDGKKGVHAEPVAEFTRYSMKGRLTGGNTVEGDGSERGRQLLYFKAPSDMKGLGTYTVMYDSAKVNSVWAYIPAVRRVRQLSGGAWMDPVGSSDQLQDDLEVFNARPCWYPEYKLLGKRNILAVSASKTGDAIWNKAGKTFAERYPVMEDKPPYWNIVGNNYEVREVYVVEAITPSIHPYSKKVLYIDTKYPRIYYGEAYNRKGEFWKFMEFHSYANAADGDIRTTVGSVIDFQRNHATISLIDTSTWRTNFDAKSTDFSLQALQAAGR